jgi:hypothetical protein
MLCYASSNLILLVFTILLTASTGYIQYQHLGGRGGRIMNSGQPGLYSKFQISLFYIVTPYSVPPTYPHDPPDSAFQVLVLQVYATTPGLSFFFKCIVNRIIFLISFSDSYYYCIEIHLVFIY